MPPKAKAVAAAAVASLVSEDERVRFRSIVAEDVKVAHRWAQFAAAMAARLLFQPWSKALADPLREEVKAVVADNPDYTKDGRCDAHKTDTYASNVVNRVKKYYEDACELNQHAERVSDAMKKLEANGHAGVSREEAEEYLAQADFMASQREAKAKKLTAGEAATGKAAKAESVKRIPAEYLDLCDGLKKRLASILDDDHHDAQSVLAFIMEHKEVANLLAALLF